MREAETKKAEIEMDDDSITTVCRDVEIGTTEVVEKEIWKELGTGTVKRWKER